MLSFAIPTTRRIDLVRFLFAIILVALYAVPIIAAAQKSIENTADGKQVEAAERVRIRTERAAAAQALAEQRKACYQKLVVTSCLNDARDVSREKLQDLKRQEIALNDVQRKRAAADRLKAIDQRNSPQTQLNEAQRRGKALETSRKREESQVQRQSDRDAKQREREAAGSQPSKRDTQGAVAPAKPQPTGRPREAPPAKLKPELRPGQAEKMAKNRLQAEQREKAAEMRRVEAVQREAKRKKPAAAGLPIQD